MTEIQKEIMDPRKINRTGVPLDQNNLGVCVVYYFIMLIYYMLYLTYHYVEYTDLGKLKFSEKIPCNFFLSVFMSMSALPFQPTFPTLYGLFSY